MSLIVDYPYLFNSDFLLEVDQMHIKTQYVKVILLSWEEEAIEEIQGKVISGNVNLDGNSAIRRTAQLSLFIPSSEVDYTNAASLISINKKIKLEIGIKNTLNKYTDYDILWFPLGLYVVSSVSISQGLTGTDVSLSLKDKMCLLNGECGGVLPASITFSEIETSSNLSDEIKIEQPTIYQIIQELVNHWGGEQLGKILISDIEERIKQVVRWNGEESIFLIDKGVQETTGVRNFSYCFGEPPASGKYKEYVNGEDIGYFFTDFTYPGSLIGEAGSTITEILDKIKNTLGNYEYFYDLEGNFRFQEIKNYLNTTQATTILNQIERTASYTEEDNKQDISSYIIDRGKGKSVYSFKDSSAVISYNNNPQYENIKNDFIVWGMRKTLSGQTMPFRYHLAIDEKPKVTDEKYDLYLYEDETGLPLATANQIIGLKYDTLKVINNINDVFNLINPILEQSYKSAYITIKDVSGQITQQIDNVIEYFQEITNKAIDDIKDKIQDLANYESQFDEKLEADTTAVFGNTTYLIQAGTIEQYRQDIQAIIDTFANELTVLIGPKDSNDKTFSPSSFAPFPKSTKDLAFDMLSNITEFIKTMPKITKVQSKDWRTTLYLQGLQADLQGTDSSYYYIELMNEWRKIYDITGDERRDKQIGFQDAVIECPTDMDFFLDFIDTTDGLNQYSVQNIGRRSKVIVDDIINCMFESVVNDIVFITENGYVNAEGKTHDEQYQECVEKKQAFCQVPPEVYDALAVGGYYNGADIMIKDLLYQYTNFNENISINCMPIYYLEPNSRITVQSEEAGISDDFIIKSISIPLDNSGTMTISANRAATKI